MAINEQNRTYTAGFAPLHLLFDDAPLFKLIGRQNVIRETQRGAVLGGTVPVVSGITLCGRWGTTARELDIQRFN